MHFFIKIQPNMSEQQKQRQRIYDFLNVETKPHNISEIFCFSFWPL